MMKAMIPPQVGMRLRTLQKNEKKKRKAKKKKERKKRRPKKKRKKGKRRRIKKMREKERSDNATILFPHLCFKIAP